MEEDVDAPDSHTEVWFRIEKDEDGYPESQDWEQLWCERTQSGFRVDNIPFFVRGIAAGDMISTKETEDATYEFDKVLSRSGHETYRLWLSDEMKDRADEILSELRQLGCQVEITLERLIAVDVPPEIGLAINEFLFQGLDEGKWEVQTACLNEEE